MRLKKPPKILILRRVSGDSMLPVLKPGQLMLASCLLKPKKGRVIIFRHDDKEKIKLISAIHDQKISVIGVNMAHSTDSRHFGPIGAQDIVATALNARI